MKIGILAREEINLSNNVNTSDGKKTSQMQKMQLPAMGLGIWKKWGSHLGIHASVLLSRAFYDVQYTTGTNVFMDADLHFTQTNLGLEYFISKKDKNCKPYLFAGFQHLYRRYGTERFRNAILPSAYWPASRLLGQTGLGVQICDNGTTVINPFIGMRFNFSNQLVYDKKMNQIFMGLAVAFALKDKVKSRYNKCPDNF